MSAEDFTSSSDLVHEALQQAVKQVHGGGIVTAWTCYAEYLDDSGETKCMLLRPDTQRSPATIGHAAFIDEHARIEMRELWEEHRRP